MTVENEKAKEEQMNHKLPGNIPDGFEYYSDFLSENEEGDLLSTISGMELQTFVFQGFAAKRKVASFGYTYSFDNRKLSEGDAFPEDFRSIVARAADIAKVSPDAFEEVLVTEYPEGAVINWHRDAPAFDIIAGISYAVFCLKKKRPHEKALQNRNSVISIAVEPRSLYIMRGAARSEWEHSIAPVKNKRYSITFRTLRNI